MKGLDGFLEQDHDRELFAPRPVFPSDKISGPDLGPEMTDPAGSSAPLPTIKFRESLRPPTGRRGCTKERAFATILRPTGFQGLWRCKTVLQYGFDWRYIYAMLIGYARVSTDDQDTAAQVAALKVAGCERIFHEKASGGRWDRPQLQQLLDQLRSGDVVVVWKLDRLSRSLRDVLTIMEQIGNAAAGFRSLTEAIDTTTPAGRMMMQMVGAFAEFERAMLQERTKAGLDAARQEGRVGGRRPKLTPQQQAEIREMVSRGDKTAADAARLFKVHPATISRLLARDPAAVSSSGTRAK